MSDFCYKCTMNLFGEEYGHRNDFAREDEEIDDNILFRVLCEGCGWIVVDKYGKEVIINDQRDDDKNSV